MALEGTLQRFETALPDQHVVGGGADGHRHHAGAARPLDAALRVVQGHAYRAYAGAQLYRNP